MNWKAVLAILTCNVVLMSASYTMLIPFLPMYLINELGVTSDNVNMWSGIIFSVTFIVSAVMAPIWGKLSDKKGRSVPRCVQDGRPSGQSVHQGGRDPRDHDHARLCGDLQQVR